jgi:hypothetical protein
VLGEIVAQHRLSLLTQIIRLLLTMIPQRRGRILREHPLPYPTDPGDAEPVVDTEDLDTLLQDVPLP